MTVALSGVEIAAELQKQFPGSIVESSESSLVVDSKSLLDVASFLKTAPDLEFDYLANLTAVDYHSHFEVVYHFTSLTHNHSLMLKVRLNDRNKPSLPSVVSLWRGADFQEREVYDLMGIAFEGHPNLKRIFLWDGFPGNPLRKDWKSGS